MAEISTLESLRKFAMCASEIEGGATGSCDGRLVVGEGGFDAGTVGGSVGCRVGLSRAQLQGLASWTELEFQLFDSDARLSEEIVERKQAEKKLDLVKQALI